MTSHNYCYMYLDYINDFSHLYPPINCFRPNILGTTTDWYLPSCPGRRNILNSLINCSFNGHSFDFSHKSVVSYYSHNCYSLNQFMRSFIHYHTNYNHSYYNLISLLLGQHHHHNHSWQQVDYSLLALTLAAANLKSP